MARSRIILLVCLLMMIMMELSSGLQLNRLPRHIPSSRTRFSYQDTTDDDDFTDSGAFDSSIEEKRNMGLENGMKPSWKAFYPFPPEMHSFRSQKKRDTRQKNVETTDKDRHELANILKDDDEQEKDKKSDSKIFTDKKDTATVKHHSKTKRQSNEDSEPKITELAEPEEPAASNPDFQDWLRREYYRNMAKTFASMRRKRDGSSHVESHKSKPIPAHKRQKKSVSFEEVTDNLRSIEDVLFLDALQTIKEAGDDYEDDPQKQNRITNDLSSAYDLETMRNALFRLKETLGPMERESAVEEGPFYKAARKRGDQCAPLDLLTSDCSSLGDIVSEGPLKRLLLHACNWHEVCYTCGEVYGLTSETCDMGFIEQSQTICRGDVPCESTASLLLLPLRQRRVFYKRSNPSVCLVDPCVEEFLKQGQ